MLYGSSRRPWSLPQLQADMNTNPLECSVGSLALCFGRAQGCPLKLGYSHCSFPFFQHDSHISRSFASLVALSAPRAYFIYKETASSTWRAKNHYMVIVKQFQSLEIIQNKPIFCELLHCSTSKWDYCTWKRPSEDLYHSTP